MVREYIESLSTVQKVFRMVTDPKRKAWQDRLHATANRFREQFPNEPTTALAVLPVDADGVKFGDAVFVLGPMVEYLEHMQLKYLTMVDFSKRKIDF